MMLRLSFVLLLISISAVSGKVSITEFLGIDGVIDAGKEIAVSCINGVVIVADGAVSYFSKESDNALEYAKHPGEIKLELDRNDLERQRVYGDVTKKRLKTDRDGKQIAANAAVSIFKTFTYGVVSIVGIRAVEYYIDFRHIDSNNAAEQRKLEHDLEYAKLHHTSEQRQIENDLEKLKLDALLLAIESDDRLKEQVVKLVFFLVSLTIAAATAVVVFWMSRPKHNDEAHEKERQRLQQEIEKKEKAISEKNEAIRQVHADLDNLDAHTQRMQAARGFMSDAFHRAEQALENAESGAGVRSRTNLQGMGAIAAEQ